VDYDSAPFPTASPDGKRVVFASNWMSSGRPVQAYIVDVRNICP
jgi:Tol biopolymer transport system component